MPRDTSRIMAIRHKAIFDNLMSSPLLENHRSTRECARHDGAHVETAGTERRRVRSRQRAHVDDTFRMEQIAPCSGNIAESGGRNREARRARRRDTSEYAGAVRRQVHATAEDDHGLIGRSAAPVYG